jgi:hypothetical protein
MVINTLFELHQKVYIPELKIWGKILSVFMSKSGRLEYYVRFFDGRDPKEVYFLEEELCLQEEEKKAGF